MIFQIKNENKLYSEKDGSNLKVSAIIKKKVNSWSTHFEPNKKGRFRTI